MTQLAINQNKTTLMKRKVLLALIIMIMAAPAISYAQAPVAPVIYKDWESLEESLTHIDVSYRVIKCASVNQIHLLVFNENITDQTAHFEIEITNKSNGLKFTKEISYAMLKATIYKAECDSDSSLDKLKIDLPSSYDPNDLTVKITYK